MQSSRVATRLLVVFAMLTPQVGYAQDGEFVALAGSDFAPTDVGRVVDENFEFVGQLRVARATQTTAADSTYREASQSLTPLEVSASLRAFGPALRTTMRSAETHGFVRTVQTTRTHEVRPDTELSEPDDPRARYYIQAIQIGRLYHRHFYGSSSAVAEAVDAATAGTSVGAGVGTVSLGLGFGLRPAANDAVIFASTDEARLLSNLQNAGPSRAILVIYRPLAEVRAQELALSLGGVGGARQGAFTTSIDGGAAPSGTAPSDAPDADVIAQANGVGPARGAFGGTAPSAPSPPPATPSRRYYTATRSNTPSIPVGTTCTAVYGPGNGTQTCQVLIVCGASNVTLYGGGTAGFTMCSGHSFNDARSDDGDPAARLDDSGGSVSMANGVRVDLARDGLRERGAAVGTGGVATPPSLAVSAPESSGPGQMDPNVVARRIRAQSSAIKRCYERQLAINPHLRGTLDVTFTLQTSGAVSGTTAQGNVGEEVAACVVGVIGRLRFSPGPVGGSVRYRFPFVFEPGG